MRRARRVGATTVALGVALALGASARPAQACAYKTNTAGQPFRWAQSCVFLTPSATLTMPVSDMTPDLVTAALWASATAWTRGALPCTYMDLELNPPSAEASHVRLDYVNSILVRTGAGNWRRDPGDATPSDANSVPCPDGSSGCLDPRIVSLTTFFSFAGQAEILDADIEINAVNYHFTQLDGPTDPRGDVYSDFQNTLTHEMGHVIGLEHSCAPPNVSLQAVTCDGDPVPACEGLEGDASRIAFDATMFWLTPNAEISKRTLSPDDINGVCGAYPIAKDPGRCEPVTQPQSCRCTVGGARPVAGWPIAASLAAVAGACVRRRRRRRTDRPPRPHGR